MYCVVIGDIVNSRGLSADERSAVQKKLKGLLGDINGRFSTGIAANFMITLGDEFQGLLSEVSCCSAIMELIFKQMVPQRIRFGVGMGDVTTEINPDAASETDGPVYHRARQAITTLKHSEPPGAQRSLMMFPIRFDTGAADSILLNSICGFLGGIVNKWSRAQWETVSAVMESGDRQIEAVNRLGLDKSTISRNLAAARYAEYRAAMRAIERYLLDTYSGK